MRIMIKNGHNNNNLILNVNVWDMITKVLSESV